jgi:hypothetical protein
MPPCLPKARQMLYTRSSLREKERELWQSISYYKCEVSLVFLKGMLIDMCKALIKSGSHLRVFSRAFITVCTTRTCPNTQHLATNLINFHSDIIIVTPWVADDCTDSCRSPISLCKQNVHFNVLKRPSQVSTSVPNRPRRFRPSQIMQSVYTFDNFIYTLIWNCCLGVRLREGDIWCDA